MTLSPTLIAEEPRTHADQAAEDSRPRGVFAKPSEQALLAGLLLALGTLALYEPALRNGFVNYDDPLYVTLNPHVMAGLSWANVRWALTAIVAGHWHPLTLLSHMLDVQLFGSNPLGHHLDSVLLHALNVVLVFLFFRQATGRVVRSAVVAALFATLPLNVEAVAWIADRKAPLSMTFLLLALLAYVWYARKPSIARYAVVVLCFALGLMSEAIVVTLPCALLLVDYWPLERFGRARTTESAGSAPTYSFAKLVLEKLPLLPFTAASAILAVHATRIGGGATSFALFPLSLRIKNAIYSYAMYLVKGVWPAHLAAFYPHPGHTLALWKVAAALVLLTAITALVLRHRQKRYLVFGWLWFLGTMVPVSGLAQSGLQGMADRYAYIPFIGLFVMAVWLASDCTRGPSIARGLRIALLATSTAVVLLAYAWVAHIQIGYWRNSYTLFSHAAQVTSRNGVAEDNLGLIFESAGQTNLALAHYQAASEYMPAWSTAHFHFGRALQAQHRLGDAAREYQSALAYEADPGEGAEALNNLGTIYAQQNRLPDALASFDAALKIYPQSGLGLMNRGIVEYEMHQLARAHADLSQAVRLRPTAQAHFWLGNVLEAQGDLNGTEGEYENALKIDPGFRDAEARLEDVKKKIH